MRDLNLSTSLCSAGETSSRFNTLEPLLPASYPVICSIFPDLSPPGTYEGGRFANAGLNRSKPLVIPIGFF